MKTLYKKFIVLGFLTFLGTGLSYGQISVTTLPQTDTENFSSYNGDIGTTPNGWSVSPNDYEGISTGTANGGGFYAYHPTGTPAEKSFGVLRSGSNTFIFEVNFTNNTGNTITDLDITFNYEQYRYSNGSDLDFEGIGALSGNVTIDADDFLGDSSGTNGTVTNSRTVTLNLTGLSIVDGANYGLRWTLTNESGADNGLAVDDFSITASGAPSGPTPGITLGTVSGNTTEAGGTATFTVVLDEQPTTTVVLDVTSADTGEVTVSPATLTFTNGNWDTPQVVTATGVDDVATDGDKGVNIDVEVDDPASDNAYDGLFASTTVTNEDDEVTYCTADFADPSGSDDDAITNVIFNTINENSGDSNNPGSGYEDYTATSTVVDQGSSYNLSVSIDPNGAFQYDVWAWFDWNQDGDFTDSGEAFDLGDRNSIGSLSTNVVIPATSTLGNTRMRVIMINAETPNPCNPQPSIYGEVEDYTIEIQANNTPTITLSETTLTGLDYVDGSGPSTEQTFTAEGLNLTADIAITAPADFEVSTTSGSGFVNSVNLSPSGGTVSPTTIYVRLESGLSVNTYSGTLTATSTAATQQDISLSGEVTVASCAGSSTTFPFNGVSGATNLEHSSSNLPGSSGEDCGTNYRIFYDTTPSTDSGGNYFRSNTGDGLLESADWGGEATFATFAIDVSGETSVEVETFGNTTGDPFNSGGEEFQWWYTLDGGSKINLGPLFSGGYTGSLTVGPTTVDVTGVNEVIVGATFNFNGGSDGFEDVDVSVTEPCSAPFQASSFSVVTTNPSDVTFDFTRGGGNDVLVLMKEGSAVDANPVSGDSYTSSSVFGNAGASEIGTGNFVVFNGNNGTSNPGIGGANLDVSVTGLTPSTTYHVAIYEYNTLDTCYSFPALTDQFTTAADPASPSIVIAQQDFDGTSPLWNYSSTPEENSDSCIADNDVWNVVSSLEDVTVPNSTGDFWGGRDLNGSTGCGTSGIGTLDFDEIFTEGFSSIVLSFDYEVDGFNSGSDELSYIVSIDDTPQPEVFLCDGCDAQDVEGTVSVTIPDGSISVSLQLRASFDGGSDMFGVDNFKIEGVFDGDSVFSGGLWSGIVPSETSGNDFILIKDGVYITDGNIELEAIYVLNRAAFEVRPQDVLTVNDKIINNGLFTFKSNASASAQLADATSVKINGDMTVERYMSNNRAFRFVSSPVGGRQTIREAWQENATTGNFDPSPSFGTHITGEQGTAGNVNATTGFDETATGNVSIFRFDNSDGDYFTDPLNPNTVTSTNVTLESGIPYALLVRGDRSINLNSNTSAGSTTLRATGNMTTGTQSSGTDFTGLNANANGFSLVPNPYQAIVDACAITRSNLNDSFVVRSVDATFGDWLEIDLSSTGAGLCSAAPVPGPGSDDSRFIPPGIAFFVQTATSAAASLEFNEDDKATDNAALTTVYSTTDMFFLNARLYTTSELQNGDIERDAFGLRFDSQFTTLANSNEDIAKFVNDAESIAVVNNGLQAIDKQGLPNLGDVVQLETSGYTTTQYSLLFMMENVPVGVAVFINDAYLGTQTEISDGFVFDFSVDTNIPESIAGDRFSLVFDNTTLGVTDNKFGTNFSVYPNPTTDGVFNISTPGLSGEANVEISNILGQTLVLQSKEITGGGVNIDAQGLSNGVYLVKLTQNNQSYTTKIIIE